MRPESSIVDYQHLTNMNGLFSRKSFGCMPSNYGHFRIKAKAVWFDCGPSSLKQHEY